MFQQGSREIRRAAFLAALIGIVPALPCLAARRSVPSLERSSSAGLLAIEILGDGLIHFKFSASATVRETPIRTTPMVLRRRYPGPTQLTRSGPGTLQTAAVRLTIDDASLCFSVSDVTRGAPVPLTTLCPVGLGGNPNLLTVAPAAAQNLYGLGEHFLTPGEVDADLRGRLIQPGAAIGNAMPPFNGGFNGNAQFPILYAIGDAGESYAIFLDQLSAQTWDLVGNPWRVTMAGDAVRGYLLAGAPPDALRQAYMDLVGRPPVPPKKVFGLWVSEFGFDDWAELEDKLHTLRANHFPLDGFMLDLEWFGGVFQRPSHMGGLTFDTKHFPHPRAEIARLRDEQGVGVMVIEEPYVDATRAVLPKLEARGFLPLSCKGCAPVRLPSWWGTGSMLDFTNPAAGDFWHDHKRQPLVEMGVLGHWTDLGEPEEFAPDAHYHGFPRLGLHTEADVHNIYNFKWHESIARGYARHHNRQRPFMLSRSGTTGIQRFGAGMWSGDIASRLSSLATHLNAEMQMSFSGIDYFGADVGGFWRSALDGDLNELYTVWFANAALLDVPLRPHTQNLCNCSQTAPDRIGDPASNLDNLRLRYRLIPYLYSLAHRAYRYGEPLIAPLPLYYPADPNVRLLADEKLLGRNLLVATVSAYGQTERDVYLPAGTWADFRTHACVESAGESLHAVPTNTKGTFHVPVFARAGAIVPEMFVDEQTMNALGARQDHQRHDELIARVYVAAASASRRFTLYEDDGETVAYRRGAVRTTEISQRRIADGVEVLIKRARGTYRGAARRRDNVIELVACGADATGVTLNGAELDRRGTEADFDANGGWYAPGDGLVRLRSGELGVDRAKRFVVRLDAR